MFDWIKKFLTQPRTIGAIAPSSPKLGELMAEDIQPQETVLELGPGTGSLTREILKKLKSPTQLTLVEIEPELAERCRSSFPGTAVVTGDIEDFLQSGTAAYDAIISGIPFAVMEKEKRDRVFRLIKSRLNPGGRFIMFQYSVSTRDELSTLFGNMETKFMPWNVPPAFVFLVRKSNK